MNSKYSWYSPLHMVRKLSGILALCAIGVLWTTTAQAQIALITASDGGFESGTSTLAANGWTGVNATSVTWFTGTAAGAATGTKAAFVGSSSTTYIGSTTAVIKHFYRDIAIPSGATQVYLNYKLKMPIIDNNYDYFYIYTNTTAQTPVSGTLPAGTVRATYTTPLLTGFTARPQIDLTALAGTTVRLVFTYKTDGSSPYANPAVDDITLTYVAAPAGCTGTSQYPFSAISAPAPGAGAYTISSAQQLDGEYNQMTGAVAGHTFMSEATAAGTYITVRASTFNGALVSSGTTPLNWTATAGGTYYITYHTNSSCGTSSAYTITKITNTTVASGCTNTSAFGSFAAPAPGAGPYQIATNQYQSEYNTMTGAVAGHTFTSTGSIAGTYITVHAGTYNGTIVAAGTTPLNWTAAAGGSYYIHYNTNSSCGTASTGMTSTITNTTVGSGCTNTTAYGSFTAPAPGAGAYTISSAQYQSEYNTMTGAVAGHTFTSTGSIAGTYITVHAGTYNGTIVAAGTTPLNWTAAAGGSYYIHYNTNSSCGTASTGMTSTITNTTAAANNDLVCDATAVTCGSTTAGTTVGFTTTGTYEGTTTCGVAQSYPGAWYSIVGNGQDMVASLCATSWDSRISIYSGTCTSLVCVGGTDDNGPACSGTSASYGWTSTNGVTYYIKVYGYSSNSTFSLNVTCSSPAPANDACANAINVNAYPYTSAVISNANATDDVPTSTCSGPNKNVWWKVSGVCGTMSAKTCTGLTNFDTEMAVFSGSCGAFTEVTCNDDGGPACSSPQSSVSWTATQGTFYYISVGSYYGSGPTGNLQLNVTVEDGDGDGVGDACDNCVSTSNASQANADGDSAGDACELCDNDPNKLAPGVCGCGVADVPTTYYADDDSDGFGDAGSPLAGYTCIVPSGYVADNSDCDDTQLLYTDNDGDGFGTGSPVACGVADNTDCDDAALLHADVDGDGFGAAANAACGIADNSDCDDTQLLYADNDGDGFGAGTPVACGVADNTDCDDTQNLYADGDGDG
ncbi:MAG TPA: hypothetical protein PLE71_15710, partial [Flavobacteriales bacterium]|nr:hypothetical protein [Flavobacteriales bacterium]HQX39525.1 hypothetical protein [Flavobacteriales bacterium]